MNIFIIIILFLLFFFVYFLFSNFYYKLKKIILTNELRLENIKNLLIEQFELYEHLAEKFDDLNKNNLDLLKNKINSMDKEK